MSSAIKDTRRVVVGTCTVSAGRRNELYCLLWRDWRLSHQRSAPSTVLSGVVQQAWIDDKSRLNVEDEPIDQEQNSVVVRFSWKKKYQSTCTLQSSSNLASSGRAHASVTARFFSISRNSACIAFMVSLLAIVSSRVASNRSISTLLSVCVARVSRFRSNGFHYQTQQKR